MTQFNELGLGDRLLQTIERLGFTDPTPIQVRAIPLALEGRDIIGLAQTGTGKTAAFGLPLIERIRAHHEGKPESKTVRALILAPTRELVNQISDNLRKFVTNTPFRVNTVVGGASINNQMRMLQKGTDILVATPGRLIDLLDRRAVFIDQATYLVLDEADQMLDMGFIHALRQIAPKLGSPRQTLLFSATMPKLMEELAGAYLTDPVRIQVAPPGKAADKVRQSVHFTGDRDKIRFLSELLGQRSDDLSLVFSRTKHGAEKLMKRLVADGFNAVSIHGNKSQGQRDRALAAFRAGEARVLVATDVAARGIDIPAVSHVYNFDLPEVPENYVHRIGRTARAGRSGEAVAFCGPDDAHLLVAIEKVLKTGIDVASGERPDVLPPKQRKKRGQRGNPRAGGQQQGKPEHRQSKPGGDRAKSGPNSGPKSGGGRKFGGKPGGNAGGGKPGGAKPGSSRRKGRPRRATAEW
ncbi:MAG: DEAD/DEAH box helicase [Pikeienuella sp.]